MRFNLRFHGRVPSGRACCADVSVFAESQAQLQSEAQLAGATAPWHFADGDEQPVPDGEQITVEHVETLDR